MSDELTLMIAEFGSTVDVYRSPEASGGKYGSPTVYASALPVLIAPASSMQRVTLAPQGLGGGRAEYIAIFLPTETRVNLGDELRLGSAVYKVLSPPANWTLGKVTELSRPVYTLTQSATPTSTINLDFSAARNSHYIGYV